MRIRFRIGDLLGLVALLAFCFWVILAWWTSSDRRDRMLYGVPTALLPLLMVALLGVRALIEGYRVELRRRPPGGTPFWVRLGFFANFVAFAAVAVYAIDPVPIESYLLFAEESLDSWLVGSGVVSGPIDYGHLQNALPFLWTLLSGPPLVVALVLAGFSYRYVFRITSPTASGGAGHGPTTP